MIKTLRIPDEPRFVHALALAVDPGDTLNLLLETGALDNHDVAIVRRTREALTPAYDHAGERRDWKQAHTIGILQQALATPDSAAYLAYHTRGFPPGEAATRFADALGLIGCAADTLGISHRRPWQIDGNDFSLPHWREQVWRLLLDMPDRALPRPPACTCSDVPIPNVLSAGHPDRQCIPLDGEAS